MTLIARIKKLCDEKKVTFAEVERKSGISNGQIRRWDTSTPNIENIKRVADFFNVSTDYLLGRTNKRNSDLTEKDERDIAKRLETIREEIEHGEGLAFDGEPMSEEAMESFMEAMDYIVSQTKRINKKYTPKKYRDNHTNE